MRRGRLNGRSQIPEALLRSIMLLATLLRDPILSSWDSSEASLGLLQALFMLAILVLALLLAGVVI